MNQVEQLFQTLRGFKQDDEPERQLLNYCNRVFGSIEGSHIDFKEKRDRRTPELHDDDKKNLAKALSGFANSGGGVLIWGLKDRTLEPKPIAEIDAFVHQMLELSSQATDPAVPGVDGDIVPSSEREGFGLLYVPESDLPPHRVLLTDSRVKDHYYIRAGSSFVVASHSQLEDMFGRRPKPKLALSVDFRLEGTIPKEELIVIIGIENEGRGTAKSPYLALRVSPYKRYRYGISGNEDTGLPPLEPVLGSAWRKYGGSRNRVIHPGTKQPVDAFKVKVGAGRPHFEDLTIEYQLAAEGIMLVEDTEVVPGHKLMGHVARLRQSAF